MKSMKLFSLFFAITLFFTFGAVVLAQDVTPNVQVTGTGIVDGTVTIAEATVEGPAWVVIHADDEGKPGPVIGYAPLTESNNSNVVVEIDEDAATPILHAMLHVDAGEVGTYEFPGADVPVKVGDAIVMAEFSAAPVVQEETPEAEGEMMAEEEMAAPASMPDTGAATSAPLAIGVTITALTALGLGVVLTRRRFS